MPRVLFVHHRPQPSGAARSLALLIGALSAEWDPHVLVPGGGAAELFEDAGATVHHSPVPAFTHTWDVQYHGLRWLVAVREAMWLPEHAVRLRRVLRDVKPDLVHLNDSVMLASGALAARAGVPVVWHLRSSLAHDGRDARSRRIARWIDRYGSAAIAIDHDVARSFPLCLQLEVIPNPVVALPGKAADLGIPAGRLAIGYFGYLRRQKGWPEFLEALQRLTDEKVDVHGVIVGGGVRSHNEFRGLRGRVLRSLGLRDEEGDLRHRISELGLEARVTFIPFTTATDPIYRALDIVVFPNQGAGLGRPVLEAAAHGVPVVASGSPHGGGILEPEETALLLERATPAALAASLNRLARDKSLRTRLGNAARARVSSPEEAASRVIGVYDRALAGRGYGVHTHGL